MFPYLVINATSLFFHNRRFERIETPAAKKNITNRIEEWAQGIPPPALKKQRTSATGSQTSRSASSKAYPNHMKTAAASIAASTNSTSCAIVVDSTTEVLPKKPARGTKRQAEDLKFDADDSDDEGPGMVSNLRYEGLSDDEDDTLERAYAVSSPVKATVAAQINKVSPRRVFELLITFLIICISLSQRSLDVRPGITVPVHVKRPSKRQGNKGLPDGALNDGRWATIFIPTFFRYVASSKEDAWTISKRDTVLALQAIWNVVYSGCAEDQRLKIKHLVQPYDAVYDVVCHFMMPLLTITANYFQSVQRAAEWRSGIGSNALAVLGDFMDASHLETTEERREVADDLLDYDRYIYLRTKDIKEGDVVVDVREAAISTCV